MALATIWTILVTIDAGLVDATPVMALDAFWPLSMAWLIVVGVAIMRAPSWPTPARYLPFAASFVIPVHLLAEVVGLSEWQSWTLPVLYVALAYALVGIAVILQLGPLAEQRHEDVRGTVAAAR